MTASLYCDVRSMTERLASPLTAEDQTVQSMPDTSPTKWHRAHTTWFFETFVLGAGQPVFDETYAYLFNSYYEAVGPRHARPERGLITRPGVDEIARYREHVDEAMVTLLERGSSDLATLGLHHEQQHQELLVMDAKHVLSRNPFQPAYGALPWTAGDAGATGWVGHDGGIVEIGGAGVQAASGFAFDNEGPRHEVLLRPFEVSTSLVTCGEWQAFVDDGGYHRPELWMSDGWATVQREGWCAPEYWSDGSVYGLSGAASPDPAAPVMHVSWYEADAFSRWAGCRLPLESEWEAVAPDPPSTSWYDAVWQWTSSPYVAYPGFAPSAGAVGEYNGKFMVNQHVLRGGCLATPPGHTRRTYRNFFPAHARWVFAGVRLARD